MRKENTNQILSFGCSAGPRKEVRNGNIAQPQQTSHGSLFLLDPTAGYNIKYLKYQWILPC